MVLSVPIHVWYIGRKKFDEFYRELRQNKQVNIAQELHRETTKSHLLKGSNEKRV